MIIGLDIMNALGDVLEEAFPERTIYLGDVPEGFSRPSFLLENVQTSEIAANKYHVEVTEYFSVTCFEPVDEYYVSDSSELLKTQGDVLRKIRGIYLEVDDRNLTITSSTAGISLEAGEAYIDIKTTFMDRRVSDDAPATGSAASSMLMGDLNINYKE